VVAGVLLVAGSGGGEDCEERQDTSAGPEASRNTQPTPSPLAKLDAIGANQAIDVRIGTLRTLTRSVTLDVTPPLAGPEPGIRPIVRGDLVREDEQSIFPADQVVPIISMEPDGALLTVRVCFDPSGVHDVDPGRYEGAISLHGADIETFTIPVFVSVRYPNLRIVFAVALGSVIGGLLAKSLTDVERRRQGAGRTSGWLTELDRYMRGPLFVVSAMVGLGIAFYAVFSIYLVAPTFGAAPQDWLRLAGFGFVSVAGGMTLTDFAAVLGRSGEAPGPPAGPPSPGGPAPAPEATEPTRSG
jgi:hypothetical protein